MKQKNEIRFSENAKKKLQRSLILILTDEIRKSENVTKLQRSLLLLTTDVIRRGAKNEIQFWRVFLTKTMTKLIDEK